MNENCNHNPNDIENTTIFLDKKKWFGILQNPRQYKGVCKCCGTDLTFIKENDEYIEI